MILKQIRVENFKAISRCVLDLTDTTVLVGSNNSGKSSILQAIHFASRSLNQASEANKQSTLSLSEIEYIPSLRYKDLAHKNTWGNVQGTPESRISFHFNDPLTDQEVVARVVLKSARNEGISVNPTIPNQLMPIFRGRSTMFSAYIPGIAGIPVQEELISRRHVFRKAASGDSNVVLRNILLRIQHENKFGELISCVRRVYKNARFSVKFNEREDLFIHSEAKIENSNMMKPLEFCGTGFLQVLQIFSYLILFKPRLLLIDEPESHLHPTLQTRLTNALQKEVTAHTARALITTHSPFVVRGLPLGSRTIWIDKGTVAAASSGESIRNALGWGALDKPIILCTEDNRVRYITEIIEQDEALVDKVSVFPFGGVSILGTAPLLLRLKESLGNKHKIVVHRDRDCMTNNELARWKQEYLDCNINVWITPGSDIEMYFCSADYISGIYDLPFADASEVVESTVREHEEEFRITFTNKRKEVNRKIYEATGGSPNIDDLWNEKPIEWKIKGKDMISKLRQSVRASGFDEKKIGNMADNFTIATDLIQFLRGII